MACANGPLGSSFFSWAKAWAAAGLSREAVGAGVGAEPAAARDVVNAVGVLAFADGLVCAPTTVAPVGVHAGGWLVCLLGLFGCCWGWGRGCMCLIAHCVGCNALNRVGLICRRRLAKVVLARPRLSTPWS